MNFLTPEQTVENFILWYSSDEGERERLIRTISDPMITYIEHDDDSQEDNARIQRNIENVMAWVNRQNYGAKNLINMLRCVADYFQEDHVDGLESIGEFSYKEDSEECIEAFKNLKIEQIFEEDHSKYHILEELSERLEKNPSAKTVRVFRANYNYLSAKQVNFSDYTITTEKLVPFLDIPTCFKIEDKVFLLGSDKNVFTKEETGDDFEMVELFDMTTEMEIGHSYSIYLSDTSFLQRASIEESLRVAKFLNSIK